MRSRARCVKPSRSKDQCGNELKARELGLGCVPDLEAVNVRADQVLQMSRNRSAVYLGARPWFTHALGDVEDDAGKSIFIDPDLLVVGYLS